MSSPMERKKARCSSTSFTASVTTAAAAGSSASSSLSSSSSAAKAVALNNYFWQSTCLKPTYSLRRQVLFSFGITGVVTTLLVVGMACICAISAGNLVQREARNFMRQEVMDSISNSSQYAAETFNQELDHLRGTVSLVVEIVRDRIANYPLEGWEQDTRVPFVTIDSSNTGGNQQYPTTATTASGSSSIPSLMSKNGNNNKNNRRRRYPLKNPLLPRDWNVTINVNSSNHEEHVQELYDLLVKQHDPIDTHHHPDFIPELSTVSAAYSFQGNCDPSVVSPTDPKYYEGCTPEHNNGTSGGAVRPTNTSAGLERKAADIGILLKPIWESRPDIVQVSVNFVNEGAGSYVHFPSFVHPNPPNAYQSQGCDWLYQNINPYTKRPFLSQELAQKNCHPKGEWVQGRDYNPLEEGGWCQDQALHSNETRFFGPVIDKIFTPGSGGIIIEKTLKKMHHHHHDNADHDHDDPNDSDGVLFWTMRVGRAIFDRYTGELIGCVAIEILLNRWSDLIMETLAVQNYSNGILVRQEDGVVVAGGSWDLYNSRELKYPIDTDVVSEQPLFDALMVELEQTKKDDEIRRREEAATRASRKEEKEEDDDDDTSQELKMKRHLASLSSATAVVECTTGRVLSAAALPGSPFLYVQAVGEEIFDVIDDVKSSIDQDIIYSTLLALLIGGAGMMILMIIVYTVSMVLTRPLKWIQGVAYSIVNHTTSNLDRKTLKLDHQSSIDDSRRTTNDHGMDVEQNLDPQEVLNDPEEDASSTVKCSPETEITELVYEFKQMIKGFSGANEASTVAKSTPHEIRNKMNWQTDFQQLYKKSKGGSACYGMLKHSVKGIDQEERDRHSQAEEDEELESEGSVALSEDGEDDGVVVDPSAGDGTRAVGASTGYENNPKEYISSMNNDEEATTSEFLFRSASRVPNESHVLSNESHVLFSPKPTVRSDFSAPLTSTTTSTQNADIPTEGRKNEGRNLNHHQFWKKEHAHVERASCIPYKSPLFRWILVLIVIPMIVTNVVILATVSERIISVLPRWLQHVETASFRIQLNDVSVASKFASVYAEAVLATPVRDLFVYNRLAGWLFTDAVERDNDAVVAMESGAEDCKLYPKSCPWADDPIENVPCDCSWEEDLPKDQCFQIEQDTRYMQRLFYAGQRHDAHPVTGVRSNVSFPHLDATAGNTSWWDDLSSVPGAFKGSNASGYETTYDRLRVSSALSTIIFPLYNYRPSLVAPLEHKFLGAFFGFEADGMLTGWAGCLHPTPLFPHFKSSESNLAYEINNTLCPKGKYGYDSRCRSWYDSGKKATQDAVNTTSLFITPPYHFVTGNIIASSITQGIADPRTGEHIGQSLIDFRQFDMLNFGLIHCEQNFHFVITPSGENVLAPPPKKKVKDREKWMNEFLSTPIGDLVLPNDALNSTNRLGFDGIVDAMKDGRSCLRNFTRVANTLMKDGDKVEKLKEETYWVAYNPIHVRALDAVQIDDYSRGLNVSSPLVYSVGVGKTVDALQRPFVLFKEDAVQKLHRNVAIYVAMTILISLLATAVTCRISVAVTRPMITLLTVVRNINKGRIDDDIPPLYGGSREVNQVYTSFAKLFKIVRVSNSAFFMRNLHWACHFVRDALKLFTKIDDRKAIAIASSNLGNTLLAINCGRARESRCSCLMVDSACCVKEAFFLYEKAIQSGTEDFENASMMDDKVEFAEQLSDRHFNRALYFLLSRDDPCATENYLELGLQDLMKAQALDLDVQEYWINNGLLIQKAGVLFERLLRRLHGLCALLENGVSQAIWDPKAVAYDCHRVLSAVWDDPHDSLFDELTPIGRLQQLEAALINLQLQRNQVADAARIAMRMLVEDEYLNEAAFQYAAEATAQYMSLDLPSESTWSVLTKAFVERDIQNMLKSCRQTSVQTKKCVFFCMEVSDERHMNNPILREQLLALYDAQCGKEDYFGLVAANANNPLTGGTNLIQLGIESKRRKKDEQRSGIESAIDALSSVDSTSYYAPMTSSSSLDAALRIGKQQKSMRSLGCKALSSALDKVVESQVAPVVDSYIVYLTDGPKQNWDWKVLSNLKSRIEETNAKRRSDIHLIILDLEQHQEPDTMKSIIKEAAVDSELILRQHDGLLAACKNLCRVSKGSAYIKATPNSLEEDFRDVSTRLSAGNKNKTCSSALLSGITMEKF